MVRFFFALVSIAFVINGVATTAAAQTRPIDEYQKTIRQLGAQADYFYVSFDEPFTTNCAYGVAYVSSAYKGIYTQLLAAKLSGRKISRLVYSQKDGAGTTCNVELVEIAD